MGHTRFLSLVTKTNMIKTKVVVIFSLVPFYFLLATIALNLLQTSLGGWLLAHLFAHFVILVTSSLACLFHVAQLVSFRMASNCANFFICLSLLLGGPIFLYLDLDSLDSHAFYFALCLTLVDLLACSTFGLSFLLSHQEQRQGEEIQTKYQ